MPTIDFSQFQRQSVRGLLLIYFQQGKNSFKTLWPIFLPIFLTKHNGNKIFIAGALLVVLLVLLLIHTILYYRSYQFKIDNQQFILNKGYLNQKTLTIPIDRVQNVNTAQTILQQVLDVMSVEIDTAGSTKKELKILALSKPVATQLAMELSRYLEVKSAIGTDKPEQTIQEEKLILRLTNRDLLRIGISQNHIQAAILLIGFGMQFFNRIPDFFKSQADKYAQDAFDFINQSGWILFSSLILFFLMIAIFYSMVRTLILYYDLRLIKLNQSYRIVSGLISRKNVLIPFRKIQQINWKTDPVKKCFGIFEVKIQQATSGIGIKQSLIGVPSCLSSHLDLLKADLFGPDQLQEQSEIHSSIAYFKRTWIYKGWIPALLFSPLLLLDWRIVFLLATWVVLLLFYSLLLFKKSYFQLNNDQIRVSSGAIAHQFSQMAFGKVQHVEFRQSIFNRKRGVASLKIGNASGTLLLPFIDATTARVLYNYLLYYAEKSDQPWM